jgi:sialate O-acetylesterase
MIFAKCRTLAILGIVFTSIAGAEVRLPHVLTDHMVVQRGLPVHIWGTAAADEPVSVSFHDGSTSTKTDSAGHWSVYFKPERAGGPYEVKVSGSSNRVTLTDVLVGDVWVASGQSNMELPMTRTDNAQAEIAAANYPKIRLLTVDRKVSDYPLPDMSAKPWTVCSPETIAGFSAVAYYFGRNLEEKLDVPIGLIESNWGGTPAEAWTSLPGLSADAGLMPVYASWAQMMQNQPAALAARQVQLAKWEADGKHGDRPYSPNQDNSWEPGGLFNAMIAPLTPFPIRGAIWYQGESNASTERASTYARLFQAMIRDWRHAWGEGDFPFLFVQLANYTAGGGDSWPLVRDAQRQALGLSNTGMAVTIDIGNPKDIHPKDKKDVGIRLALAARAITFGEKLESSGPLYRQVTPTETSSLRVWFDHADGLKATSTSLTGFEIAGTDRKFKPAEARIEGSTIIVSSPEVPSPAYVRYGWADNPTCDLINSANLPASPFSSL